MKTVLIEGRTLPGVYHNALYELYETPEREMSVVRCVECWHRFTGHFGMMCIGRPNDFFCANGERRKDDEVD